MAPFKLTSEQYKACWEDRIEHERTKIAEVVAEQEAKKAATRARAEAAQARAEAILAEAAAVPADDASDRSSAVSSYVSNLSASATRVERLEIKLRQEQDRRKQLEKQLARAREPSLIG